jgi:hypothetical protein
MGFSLAVIEPVPHHAADLMARASLCAKAGADMEEIPPLDR